jgi:hypothetical protein
LRGAATRDLDIILDEEEDADPDQDLEYSKKRKSPNFAEDVYKN